jgi:hypothetical protein
MFANTLPQPPKVNLSLSFNNTANTIYCDSDNGDDYDDHVDRDDDDDRDDQDKTMSKVIDRKDVTTNFTSSFNSNTINTTTDRQLSIMYLNKVSFKDIITLNMKSLEDIIGSLKDIIKSKIKFFIQSTLLYYTSLYKKFFTSKL